MGLTCADGKDQCFSKLKGRWALTPSGAVSSGRWHSCALSCVGNSPQLEYADQWVLDNSSWGGVAPSTCNQGRVVCWGDDRMSQGMSGLQAQGAAQYDDFVSVCAAAAHSCAVRSGGQLHCWGYNGNNRIVMPDVYRGVKWQSVRCKVSAIVSRSALFCPLLSPSVFGTPTGRIQN